MRTLRSVLMLALAGAAGVAPAGCRSPGRQAPAAGAVLRDRARLVLESHCGECHIGGWDRAPPRALAVFDLTQPEYFAGMTRAQLASVQARLGPGAPPIDPHNALPVTAAERAAVTAYLASLRR